MNGADLIFGGIPLVMIVWGLGRWIWDAGVERERKRMEDERRKRRYS